MTAERLLSADALTHDLAALPLEPADVVAGEPRAAVVELGSLGDVEIGIWSLTPGAVTDTEADEVFVVLSGRGSLRFEDGATIDLAPGVIVRLREGERTSWAVTETIRKVYLAR